MLEDSLMMRVIDKIALMVFVAFYSIFTPYKITAQQTKVAEKDSSRPIRQLTGSSIDSAREASALLNRAKIMSMGDQQKAKELIDKLFREYSRFIKHKGDVYLTAFPVYVTLEDSLRHDRKINFLICSIFMLRRLV
jgi:hypothetical protein